MLPERGFPNPQRVMTRKILSCHRRLSKPLTQGSGGCLRQLHGDVAATCCGLGGPRSWGCCARKGRGLDLTFLHYTPHPGFSVKCKSVKGAWSWAEDEKAADFIQVITEPTSFHPEGLVGAGGGGEVTTVFEGIHGFFA